nr:acetyl-CoA carboxylase carboxyltransferase beta subunit [Puelia olyriformis]
MIEYAIFPLLPCIIVCASGRAHMQEESYSLIKKPKIASTLRHYQSTKKPYVSILTTGGIRASFGMLGDILISKPDAHLAFVGVREWLKKYCMWKEVDETKLILDSKWAHSTKSY